MPDTPSNDDEFADLFRKLPTAADRRPGDPASAGTPPTPPLSRREARAAAERAGGTEPDAAAVEVVPSAPAERPAAPADQPIDELFAAAHDEPEHTRAARHDRDRRKSRIAAWATLGVIVAFVAALVAGGFWVWNTYEDQIRAVMGWEEPADYEAGQAEGEISVTIVSGDTGATISDTLYDAGVTKTPDAFYDYLIGSGAEPTFQPGVYTLQQKMTSAAALAALLDPASKQENTAQLPEGLTVAQTLPRLADGVGIPLEELQNAVADPAVYGVSASSLEGWLFPATYTFDDGVTAQGVIQTLVDRTVTSLDEAGVPADRRQEVLTIASIIEREARYQDDFFKVSRVIQNRLDPSNTETAGLLQMDSTAQYGFGEMHDGTVSTSDQAQHDDNPWNTYVHRGLPAGPIANPGDLAIDAAMHPADGPWLYFVTVNPGSGETEFATTYDEHLKLVERFQQWCADHPDSGDC